MTVLEHRYHRFVESTILEIRVATTDDQVIQNLSNLADKYLTHKVYVTGVGKCSYLAMKHAATLRSLCIDAEYLDCVNAVHGDLGPMTSGKPILLVALSKSGLSNELLPLFETLSSLQNVEQVLITMPQQDSVAWVTRQKQLSEFGVTCITLPTSNIPELDGFGIVPSASNAIFEVILSSITTLMEITTIELLQRLQKAHPGGSLQGKVSNILTSLENED